MPDHVRKQIRDHVAAGLSGLPTTGTNVYVGRTRPLPAGHAPSLLIYMRSETSARSTNGLPPLLDRVCTLYVEGRVSTAEVPDDLLDKIAAEVEQGVASLIAYQPPVTFFGSLALNVQFVGTELIAEADGERQIGGVRLEYRVTYRTGEGSPTSVS